MDNETITVHQCLHGYADGHELIESSAKLSSQADQILLTMSDMSGPSMVSGYRSYLTGYPLPGSTWYAFAQTWYAKEMPRPGCVWTHTLLIDTADLAVVADMKLLCKLFVRPGTDRKHYRKPLSLSLPRQELAKRTEYSTQIALSLLSGLYQTPDRPVFISSQDSEEYSDLILELWSQQYAKLRRVFLFSTGSLSNRTLERKPFDLQIIPRALSGHILREVPDAHIIEGKSEVSLSVPDSLKLAADDLLNRCDDRLRSFLMFFGADASEGRAGFCELLAIFSRIINDKRETSVSDILSVLSEYYPKPEQARLLKQSLLGGVDTKLGFLPAFSESQLFLELATTLSYQAFQNESLKFQQRAAKFAEEPVRLKNLLVKLINESLNPIGEEIIRGIALGIRPEELVELARDHSGLLLAFSKYNPALLATKQSWQQPADHQRELYDLVIPLLKKNAIDLSALIHAMLDAGSDVLSHEILRQFGFEAVAAVLNWVESNTEQVPSEWVWQLRYRNDDLVNWLRIVHKPHDRTIAVLGRTLDPHSAQVLGLGNSLWMRLPAYLNESPNGDSTRVWCFLLSLGFNNVDENAQSLVAASFQIVHDRAERDELPYQSWQLLMSQAPSLSWWGEWDKCKRLRHALVDHSVRYDWDPQIFASAVKRSDTLREIVEEYGAKSAGGRFLRRVAFEVNKRNIQVSEEIRRTLAELS